MFLSKGYRGIYYLYYKDEITGKKRKISTKTKLKGEANKFLKEFNPDSQINRKKLSQACLENLKNDVLNYAANNLSMQSIYAYKTVFKHLELIIGNKLLKLFSFYDIENYKAERIKKVSRTSVNIELRTMKAIFNYAIRAGYVAQNPLKDIKPFTLPQKERLSLNKEEIGLILNTITNKNIKNIVKFGLFTGCRIGEILNVQWSDIDLQKKILTIKNKPNFKTKTGKIRYIPVSDSLYVLLRNMLDEKHKNKIISLYEKNEYIFNRNGHVYNQGHISRTFKKYLRLAGIDERFHLYHLRHSFLSSLAAQGVSIYLLKEIAGHSDIKTTEIYLHTVTEDLRNAVNKMQI